MQKILLLVLVSAVLCLCGCATRNIAETQLHKNTTVIVVAKNGAVSVGKKRVQLQRLVSTLKSMGVTKESRLAVEGETGTRQSDIDQVLETLAVGGLLPKGTID